MTEPENIPRKILEALSHGNIEEPDPEPPDLDDSHSVQLNENDETTWEGFFAERDCPFCGTHLYKSRPDMVIFCGCGNFTWR